MRVLVLGAYGLIGEAVARRLLADGHHVAGLGRDTVRASRRLPQIQWIAADLAGLTRAGDWLPLLEKIGAEAIVNCAGALQNGARDDVARVQSAAMRALYDAAPRTGVTRVIQISAPRADDGADTTFMRTKGEADAALAATSLDWIILRPGLVIGPQAYGGTALLRALASVPLVQPALGGMGAIQTVALTDVADAVARAVRGDIPVHATYDLVEDEAHSLDEVARAMRHWLGWSDAPGPMVPAWAVALGARIGDALGWLGWRPPLRTTAIRELQAGVTGDPGPWRAATGAPLSSLSATLAAMPSTVQERWFARSFLLKPAVIATLSAFWLITGIVTLLDPEAAARVLTLRGLPHGLATSFAVGGALVDIALGLAMLWRPAMMAAAQGMIVVTLAYLAGGTLLAPDLWADPLGPLVKAVPAMLLAVVALAWTEDR